MHHARLKNVLEKLIVVHSPTRLDFKHPTLNGGVSISVETLQYLTFAPKQDGDNDLVLDGLPFLDPKSQLLQAWAEPSHNGVTMLIHRCARIDSVSHFFEERDDKESEFRRR